MAQHVDGSSPNRRCSPVVIHRFVPTFRGTVTLASIAGRAQDLYKLIDGDFQQVRYFAPTKGQIQRMSITGLNNC